MNTTNNSIANLLVAAEKIHGAALRALDSRYETRRKLAEELIRQAKAAGFDGRDVEFIASKGLSLSGYGGGV